ncbi:hypothetical protein KGQ20_04050 [Catenulispora sp. NF23]|uniref:Uncharacterized protein n=1 Tax=Catenulispora pinistramenti TaxID=2705254 RepID=A0ABS5KIT9_9ACTN|nr:hypothetical protein [Catenulispora pinistramenti]MBS2531936.1 hypothetical protein [Catenulispora pinistramenti]MBS2546203.1 hypothetical protein [Catenulispora pinistramenti]
MEEPDTSPERAAERKAATLARLAQERAAQLERVKARTAGTASGIPGKTAHRFVYSTDPRLAGALRVKRERQRDERANRQVAWQLSGPRFTPYSGGRRKRADAQVTAAVRTIQPARAVPMAPAPQSFTQVMDTVGADRKWFATGANQ